jgi:hypothetical protein
MRGSERDVGYNWGVQGINKLYSRLECAFLSCGLSRKVKSDVTPTESWWRLVPQNLRDDLARLEQRAVEMTRSWVSQDSTSPSTDNLITL